MCLNKKNYMSTKIYLRKLTLPHKSLINIVLTLKNIHSNQPLLTHSDKIKKLNIYHNYRIIVYDCNTNIYFLLLRHSALLNVTKSLFFLIFIQ